MPIISRASDLFETSFTCWSTFLKSYFRSGICLGGLRQSILQHEVQLHLRMANTAKEQVMSSICYIRIVFIVRLYLLLVWKPLALPENRLILIDDVILIFYLILGKLSSWKQMSTGGAKVDTRGTGRHRRYSKAVENLSKVVFVAIHRTTTACKSVGRTSMPKCITRRFNL